MALTVGSRLGAYEIVGSLGAGGMGEVYRARDTKLGREVAIKILPELFAGDSERLARFEREARTLASLNHPHIAQIYALEVALDVARDFSPATTAMTALVMELVEGEDLAQRIARGPIPIDEAIPIATQIAAALDAAHEQGIIHRDLKPANIKLRSDGTVKVLDFGLAKALEGAGGAGGSGGAGREVLLNSPTITSPAMTMQGMILGTAAYMAPEQAKGKAIDKRADIWAFACVLYEMLSGRRAFEADDVSDTIAHVLTKDVNWALLPASTPVGVRAVLRRCLQRDRNDRLRDIGDARLQLQEAIATLETAVPYAQPSRVAMLTPWLIAAAAIAAAAVTIVRPWQSSDAPPVIPTRFVLQAPASTEISDVLLSRDGSFVVYHAGRIYVQMLSEFAPRALQGTESASKPFLSPDDRWVGFYADGAIKKAPIGGGDPLTVTRAGGDSPGAGWIHDNRILFSPGWNDGALMSVSADGGPVTAASTLDKQAGERGHWWPEPLPDRRHVLFTIWKAGSGLSESTIAVLDLQTGQHRRLFLGAMARYADGHLLYHHAGAYYAVRFDPTTQTTIGDPHAVLPDATDLSPTGSDTKPFSVAENGTIAYLAGELHVERTLTWVARGSVEQPTKLTLHLSDGRLDPRDQRLAVSRVQSGTSQNWIYDLSRGTEQRINAPGMNWGPVWHPDGQRLLFTSMRNGDFDVYLEPMNGSPAEPVLIDALDASPTDWLADGRVVVNRWHADGGTSVELYDPANKTSVPVVTGSFEKGQARVSPDGKWLSVFAAPTGRTQLYVRPLLKPGELQPIGAGVMGGSASWASRAKQLFYIRGTELIAAHYDDRGDRFVVLKEETIAQVPPRTALLGVTADAQRVLIAKPESKASNIPSGVRIVLNGLASPSP